MPSISMLPSKSSTMRLKLIQIVDFPAPVLPTTPTFIPAFTKKDKLRSTGSVVGLYFNVTFLNST